MTSPRGEDDAALRRRWQMRWPMRREDRRAAGGFIFDELEADHEPFLADIATWGGF